MQRYLQYAVLGLCFAVLAGWVFQMPGARAATNASGQTERLRPGDCTEVVPLLKSQQAEMNREFRRMHRELVALKQQLAEPGMREIIGGIGYILGLFGVAFFVYARSQWKATVRGD